MSNRIAAKALSSLTLIIAGTAAASAAPAHLQVTTAGAELNALTSIEADLDLLRNSEFSTAQEQMLADGHHSDSFGSHHHHEATKKEMASVAAISNSRFDV